MQVIERQDMTLFGRRRVPGFAKCYRAFAIQELCSRCSSRVRRTGRGRVPVSSLFVKRRCSNRTGLLEQNREWDILATLDRFVHSERCLFSMIEGFPVPSDFSATHDEGGLMCRTSLSGFFVEVELRFLVRFLYPTLVSGCRSFQTWL